MHPDINECEDEHDCSQICKNLIGSYTCDCMDGFLLEADEKQCKGNEIMIYGINITLLFQFTVFVYHLYRY